MYLKISPMKGVVRYHMKGNLISHYVGPYEIFYRVGKVPSELASVHVVLHIPMLKKCITDPESIIPIKRLSVKYNLSIGTSEGGLFLIF